MSKTIAIGYHCIHRTGSGCEGCEASLPSILGGMMMVGWKFWRRGPIDHKAKARKAYNKKLYRKAEPHLRKCLTADEDDMWALDVLARLLMNTNRHGEAISFWKRYDSVGGDSVRAKFQIAKCLRVEGEFFKTLKILESLIIQGNQEDEVWEEVQRTILVIDDIVLLEDMFTRWEKANVENPVLDMLLLRMDIIRDDIIAVTKRITHVLTNAGSGDIDSGIHFVLTPRWRLGIAGILIDGDLPSHALMVIEPLDSEDPRRTKLEITAHRLLGEHELAGHIVNTSPNIKSGDHGVLLSAIRLAWDIGDLEGVIEYCETLLSIRPSEPIASRFRLQALVKIGDILRLRIAVDAAILENNTNIQALRIAIDIAFSEDNEWEKTIKLCDLVLKELPSDRRSLCHSAISQARMGHLDKAKVYLEEALEHHPESDEMDLARAHISWNRKDGEHISLINRMLERHHLSPIFSTAENHNISVESLSCHELPICAEPELISVIMTVYGGDEYLDVAIDSILQQTYSNLELIIIDDCSTDDVFEHLKQRQADDPRIKTFQMEKNGGTYLAKNFGLTQSSGDFITFMDSDDWTHPQRLERQYESLISNLEVKAVWHSNFRIDENGNINYKGSGAIRKACISLMIKREVHERVGFFDSLRVGADTEFIERIVASYGEEALLYDPLPTMFMMQLSDSLTGGGRFHISWRSITGERFAHHSSFREWHRKIVHQKESPFVSYPLRVRPFSVPEAMFAGEDQWREGDEKFSSLIAERDSRWWTKKTDIWYKFLSDKMAARRYALLAGTPVPKLLWSGKDMNQLPELHELPPRVVIKPAVGWSAHNVFCLNDGVNILDDEEYDKSKILKRLKEDEFLGSQTTVYMVEEMLLPEVGRESDGLPRDYKFYCYGEQIALVHVVLRRSSIDQYANIHHYLDCDLKPVPRRVMTSRPVPDEPFPLPHCWDMMLHQVRDMGKGLNCFMRIDMFATDKGPVFGEFTPTPEGGNGYSDWADKYLATFWKGLEGVDEGSIPKPPEWLPRGGLD